MRLPSKSRFRQATWRRRRSAGPSLLASSWKRKVLPLVSLAAVFLMFGGPFGSVQAEVTNRIVAVVNNEIVTWLELEKKMRELLPRGAPVNNPEVQKQVLFQLIDEKLLGSQIRKLNLQVSKEEIDRALSRIQEDQGIKSPEEFAALLARDGLKEEDLRARLRDQILRFKLISREIGSKVIFSGDQISAYYQKNRSKFQEGERVHLAQITILNSDYASPEAAKARTEEIAALFRQGESFDSLARKFSRDPSASQGGDLGFFALPEIDPDLAQNLARLKPGETTPVLNLPEGWRLVQLVKREATKSAGLEEVKDQIQEKLYQEEVEARAGQWLLKLRERSSIQIML
jgi:peptidyl-prolyl cis-trans isomerase SurA